MKALISREGSQGKIAEVGTSNRTVVSHYKTQRVVMRFASKYAQGKSYRVEFFHDGQFYNTPFEVIEVKA